MSEKRLIGDYPVIGIRPIIDARKGILDVRGSLEGQTMAMAQAAKQLLETNLKYTDGSPVRVIIADQTIGRVAESAACAEKFKKEGDDTEIPRDVQEKLLRFGRAAVAAATMRGKSYLQIGAACMGISGSAIDPDFFEEYLGMRVESVDEVEVLRRIELEIYDQKEYEKALAWTKEKCPEGFDKNPEHARHTREQKEKNWEFTVKCALVI